MRVLTIVMAALLLSGCAGASARAVTAPSPSVAEVADSRLALVDADGGEPVPISQTDGKYPDLRPTS